MKEDEGDGEGVLTPLLWHRLGKLTSPLQSPAQRNLIPTSTPCFHPHVFHERATQHQPWITGLYKMRLIPYSSHNTSSSKATSYHHLPRGTEYALGHVDSPTLQFFPLRHHLFPYYHSLCHYRPPPLLSASVIFSFITSSIAASSFL